jgi:hypothetical protein
VHGFKVSAAAIPVFAFYVYTTASLSASCRSLLKVDEQLLMYFPERP